ncbi:MAG: thiamine pyrophosphate-dependent dehydrogenase E1 component subunit alpha [Alphaproteobacteria bacterium]|nr:thiamine pyrophosphate-dependent dehydrogenase E1 component subunit alpha [Alphaproteobacteria bacterium]
MAKRPTPANAPSIDTIAALYTRMKLVRLLEEAIGILHKEGKTRGPIHRCDGQEAVGIGVTAALEREDVITSTHRGHAHYIGKGVDAGALMAEIMGRATGTCRGRGGHMLVADRDNGLLGGCGIVGGALPIAVGQALAFQVRKRPNVVVTFLGDGAAQIGAAHEAMNVASLWKLPVVFVCEHNEYGLTVPAREQSSVKDIATRAAGYGMPGEIVDGNDLVAVVQATGRAVQRARRGEGPSLIEAKTYRLLGFSTSDVGGYQPAEEVQAWLPRDPILRTRARLVAALGEPRVATLDAEAAAECARAVDFALASPLPPVAELDAGEYVAGAA